MVNTKRIFTSVIAFTLIFCTLFSICFSASAATCSYGTQTRTITVRTKSNYLVPGSESITLSQSKGTCTNKSYNIFTRKTTYKTSKEYGEWDIVARATDGSHTFTKTLKDGSVKLNLKPNKTYNITVKWDAQAVFFKELKKGSFTSYPTWKVKSTWKVSSYY